MNLPSLSEKPKTPRFNFCIGCVFGIFVGDLYKTYRISSISLKPHVFYFVEVYLVNLDYKDKDIDGEFPEYKKGAPAMELLQDEGKVFYEGAIFDECLKVTPRKNNNHHSGKRW